MIGQKISHYKILSKLGEGGMGVVYRAEDLTLGRTVALKFLPPDSVAREEDRARLVHEARAAAALLHPNICPIHEIAEAEGRTFISMAYIEGRSLKDRIAERPVPLDEALSIARQIGDALASAHAKGIIHRDIKPANVMLTVEGRPMLMDFGLAKVSGATKLTRTGTTMGTVAYMSPEQVQGKDVDHRSDLWALGVVLYEMVSGRMPFGAEYEAALLYSILNEEPPALAGGGSDIPAGLDGIVAKALAKDPARRYQKAEDLVADLDALARDSEALPAGKAVPAKGLKRVWRRSRPWQRAAAAVSLAIAIAAAVLLALRFWPGAADGARFKLAIMDFQDVDSPDSLNFASGLTELVSTSLTEADVIGVVSSELLHDLRRRFYGSRRGAVEESQIFDLARKVEATLFLVGTVRQTGATKRVSWRLVDVRNGVNAGVGDAEGGVLDLSAIANQIVKEAIPKIGRVCGVAPAKAASSVESMTTENSLAYMHYWAGLLAKEEARDIDAIREMEKAVSLDSTFALAYYELAGMTNWFMPGGYEKSREYVEKAWRLKSRLSKKDQMRVEARYEKTIHEIPKAIDILREALKKWPDDRQLLIDLAENLYQWWQVHEAVQVADAGRSLYPDEPKLNGPFYSIYLRHVGRMQDALRASQSWARKYPDQAANWESVSMGYLAMGMPDSAEVIFRKVMEIDPGYRLEIPAYIAYQRGDLKSAMQYFDRILERQDISEGERYNLKYFGPFSLCLTSLYIDAGQYARAREFIGDNIEVRNLSHPIFRLLLAMDRAAEVRELYTNWAPHGDDYPRPLGRAFAMLGDANGARKAAEQIRGREHELGAMARYDALEIDARAALVEGDARRALDLLKQMRESAVWSFGFADIDYWTALAMAYRMEGRLEKAAEAHRQMLKIHGGHALSHYELGKLYEEMKRPAEAKKEYARFLEMWSEADADRPQLIDAKKRIAEL